MPSGPVRVYRAADPEAMAVAHELSMDIEEGAVVLTLDSGRWPGSNIEIHLAPITEMELRVWLQQVANRHEDIPPIPPPPRAV